MKRRSTGVVATGVKGLKKNLFPDGRGSGRKTGDGLDDFFEWFSDNDCSTINPQRPITLQVPEALINAGGL
jgi:hypothetical protein